MEAYYFTLHINTIVLIMLGCFVMGVIFAVWMSNT